MNAKSWLCHTPRNRLQSLLMLLVMAGFTALLGGLLWDADGVQWLFWLTVLNVSGICIIGGQQTIGVASQQ